MRAWTLLSHFAWACWRWRRLRGRRLREFQDQRARDIIRFAVARAPFYRRHFAGYALNDWRTLPSVDKSIMMANFNEFNTRGICGDEAMAVALRAEESRDFVPTLHGVTVGMSSGTSGHRGLFLVSPDEQAAWAGFLLARTVPSLRLRGYTVAFFLRSNSNLYESLGSGWLRFRYHDLMTPLDRTIAALNASLPDIVVGPPSLLELLAGARETGTLLIQPERVISVAEVLEPQDRDRLVGVFACPVHQIYQCTEGLLAISCPHGSLHLQEDLVSVQLEPVPAPPALSPAPPVTPFRGDKRSAYQPWAQPASDPRAATAPKRGGAGGVGAEGEGERFTPIVTDLWRRTQPIIRYRLNDVVKLDQRPCACGSTFRVLAQIEGRCDDVLHFQGRDGKLRVFFADTVRRMVLLASAVVLDYQAYQEKPGHLRVHLAVPADTDFAAVTRSIRGQFQRTMEQYDCEMADLSIERGLPAAAPGRKRRRVQRLT